MLKALRDLSVQDAQLVLADVAATLLPSPSDSGPTDTSGVRPDLHDAVLAEVRHRARAAPSDASAKGTASVLAALSQEMDELALPKEVEAEVKGRLGERGELPLGAYDLKFTGPFEAMERLGVRRAHVEASTRNAERWEHLTTSSEESADAVRLSFWEHTVHGSDPFTLLTMARRRGSTMEVEFAARLYHSDFALNLSGSPMGSLRAFVSAFGIPFRLFKRPPSSFMFDDVFPVSSALTLDPKFSLELVGSPGGDWSAWIGGRISPLSVAHIGIAFVVDIDRFRRSLIAHGVHVRR